MSQAPRIAVLGWGSLLWEPHAAFDEWHEAWKPDGPELPLEFSRISSSRLGALTLVIDGAHGQKTRVSYCLSKRKNLDDAIADLRCREGTVIKKIGFIRKGTEASNSRDEETKATIASWAEQRPIDAVIWTALESNFEKICGKAFSVDAASAHIQSLDAKAKVKAAEYVWRAPLFIDTPLRRRLEADPWSRQS